jgi:hypothetical protein
VTRGTVLRARRFESFEFLQPTLPAIIISAMPSGGRRPGAGRPKGAKDKRPRHRTRERVRARVEDFLVQAKAEAAIMPVEWLLKRLNDPELSPEYRDKLAAMVAPYVSPRLTAVSITKRPAMMNDDELAALAGLAEEDLLRLGIGRDKWPRPLH